MHPDWARGIRDQCRNKGVAFFFKQWGTAIPGAERQGRYRKIEKRIARRLLDGIEHNAMPAAAAKQRAMATMAAKEGGE
jgi:protein gp37